MFNFKTLLLSLALLCGAGAAVAGPTYHVTLDTSAHAGLSGLLDFTFLAASPDVPQTTATLSNFSGAYGVEAGRIGAVSGAIPGLVSLTDAAGDNWLTQAVSLGGIFGFDITFDDAYLANAGLDGSTFALSLYNDDFSQYIGIDGPLLRFDVLPGLIMVSDNNDIARIALVPEPSELLLVLTGLMMMGMVVRRRVRNGGR
jgi:hypothetical protein